MTREHNDGSEAYWYPACSPFDPLAAPLVPLAAAWPLTPFVPPAMMTVSGDLWRVVCKVEGRMRTCRLFRERLELYSKPKRNESMGAKWRCWCKRRSLVLLL